MRSYIRHPASIPIAVSAIGCHASQVKTNNLSAGGLSFFTDLPVKVGAMVDLLISYVTPYYQGEGVIVWRRPHNPEGFEVGVRFATDDEYFRVRMVEQVCQIEKYRQEELARGRYLTSEEAAMEWIDRNAAHFDDKSQAKH